MRSPRKHRGTVVIWVYMTVLLMLMFVGYGTDAAWVYLVGNQLQNAADAAALAGAQQLSTSTSAAITEATAVAQANKAGGAKVQVAANPSNLSTGDIVVGTYDTSSGTFTATLTNPNAVQVTCRRTSSSPGGALSLNFSALVGFSSSNITRHSIAMVGSADAGLIVLDPSASGALTLNGSASVNIGNGDVIVNSSSTTAVQGSSGSAISAQQLYTHGNDTGARNWLQSGSLAVNSPVASDPLASLPPPAQGTTQTGNSTNLQPGYYPNGLPAGKNLVLAAGVYYIDGGINITGNCTCDASAGCCLYLHSGGITCSSGASLICQPPTTGTYAGCCIYEDRSNTSPCTVQCSSGSCGGTIYCPSSTVTISGSCACQCNQLICDKCTVNGSCQGNIQCGGGWGFWGGWGGSGSSGGSGGSSGTSGSSSTAASNVVYLVK